jgi:hypothetical protein
MRRDACTLPRSGAVVMENKTGVAHDDEQRSRQRKPEASMGTSCSLYFQVQSMVNREVAACSHLTWRLPQVSALTAHMCASQQSAQARNCCLPACGKEKVSYACSCSSGRRVHLRGRFEVVCRLPPCGDDMHIPLSVPTINLTLLSRIVTRTAKPKICDKGPGDLSLAFVEFRPCASRPGACY